MRRWTLITLVAILVALTAVAVVTFLSARGPDRPPGPELSPDVTPAGP